MVQKGDRVRVQGREACVVSSWGQGKHTVWSLDDNTTVLDLEEKIKAGDAEVLSSRPTIEPNPVTKLKSRFMKRELEDLPKEFDDIDD
jgi:hypothetical protein